MPTPTFSLGRDAQIVVNGPFGQIELNATEFKWQDHTHEIMSRPLNGLTQIAYVPDYCSGSFSIDRDDATVETLCSKQKQTYYAGAAIPTGTMFVYITEINGSQTTMQFSGVAFRVSDGGTFKQDDAVKQTIEWSASTMALV